MEGGENESRIDTINTFDGVAAFTTSSTTWTLSMA
jgi:hypothetical protein